MIELKENVALAPYTGFKIGGPARYFCIASTTEEINEALEFGAQQRLQTLVLGSGTNMVVSDEGYDGLVIKLETKGIEFDENGDDVLATVQAGEVWDDFVKLCVEKEYWGVENLSYIPGTCGAFVVQNVGAYGQDASQVVISVTILDKETGNIGTMSNADCYFAYRQSVFNTVFKDRFVVLSLTLQLSKIPKPNLLYADVHRYFDPGCVTPDAHTHEHEILKPDIQSIRKAIIDIRNKKFTLPNIIPNAGSFFKNLLLDENEFEVLVNRVKENYDDKAVEMLVRYKDRISANNIIKIPTAFLIDLCGLKGAKVGGAQVNESQPLVIINASGSATSDEILQLMQVVRKTVYQKTGMTLYPETELVGFDEAKLEQFMKVD